MIEMTLDDATLNYREAEAARLCATRLAFEARRILLEMLDMRPRYTTLGRMQPERGLEFRKQDVDYIAWLSPSQRKRMRLLKYATKKERGEK